MSMDQILQQMENGFMLCNGAQVKEGENILRQFQSQPQYPQYLLQYILPKMMNESQQVNILRAAIELKNWSNQFKDMEKPQRMVYRESVEGLKQSVEHLLEGCQGQPRLWKVLTEAILNVATVEYPSDWQSLPQFFVQKLSLQNLNKALQVSKLMYKVTEKYDHSSRSDVLYTEIIHMVENTHDHLLSLMTGLVQEQEREQSSMGLSLTRQLVKIVHCLLAQDIHPLFEDNLQNWLALLSGILRIQRTGNQNTDGPLFKAKGECLRLVLLYVLKYSAEFQFEGLIQQFSEEIWKCCTEGHNEKMMLNALKYFRSLVHFQQFTTLFTQNMQQIMDTLVVPNLKASEQDLECFQDDSQQFLVNYFEPSIQVDRREATVQLLQQMTKKYTPQAESLVMGILQNCNMNSPVEQQIVLINLLCDGFCHGYTALYGCTELKAGQVLIDYFNDSLLKAFFQQIYIIIQNGQELHGQLNSLQVAFYLRYLFVFRNFIDKQVLVEYIKLTAQIARSPEETLRKIAFTVLKHLVNIQTGDFIYLKVTPYFLTHEQSFMQPVLESIGFQVYQHPLEIPIIDLARTLLSLLGKQVIQYVKQFSEMYQNILSKLITQGYTSENAFLVFEGMAMLVNLSCDDQNNQNMVESLWLDLLSQVFSKDSADLVSFVLQLLAILVTKSHGRQLQPHYNAILENLLQNKNWNNNSIALFPAQTIYLESIVRHSPSLLPSLSNQLNYVLQQLLISNSEQYFFSFVYSLYALLSLQQLQQSNYMNMVISNCHQYYQSLLNTPNQELIKVNFVKHFLMFIARSIRLFGAQEVAQMKEFPIIQEMIGQECEMISNLEKGMVRRTVLVAMSDLLFQAYGGMQANTFSSLLEALVKNIANNQDRRFLQYQRMKGRQVQEKVVTGDDLEFKKLSLIPDNKNIVKIDITDEVQYFGQMFKQFYAQNPINIQSILSEDSQKTLTKVIQELKQ